MRCKGIISDWNDERGFGFIQPAEGGARVFLHIKAIRDRTVRPINGKRVTYELGRDDRGRPRAENVRDSLMPNAPARQPGMKPHLAFAAIASALFLTGVAVLALADYLTGTVAICYWSASFIVFCVYWLDNFCGRTGYPPHPRIDLTIARTGRRMARCLGSSATVPPQDT